MTAMLEHALAYAARGWRVFPCHPATKRPLVELDRDPDTRETIPGTGWQAKASADPALLELWWKRWPRAMIGLPTGRNIGAFVLDIDAGEDKDTGEIFEAAALQLKLEAAIGIKLPGTLFSMTPRGGVHLFFRLPDGPAPGNRADLLGKGSRIDVRGEGGYVVAAPSVREDGRAYKWGGFDLDTAVADGDATADAPAELLDCVFRRGKFGDIDDRASAPGSIREQAAASVHRPREVETSDAGMSVGDDAVRKYALAALDGEIRRVEGAREGSRNASLNEAALKLGKFLPGNHLSEGMIRASLMSAAEANGLVKADGRAAAIATIDSGLRKGRTQPVDLDDIRRKAEQRQRRPRASAAASAYGARPPNDVPLDDDAWAPLDSSPSPRSPAPAPRQDGDGRPSSQTGATVLQFGVGGAGKPPARSETDEQRNMRLAFFPLTDLGNAERFYERFAEQLKFCSAIGWLGWDLRRWSTVEADERVKIAEHQTVRAIQDEARTVRDSGRKDPPDGDPRPGARDYVFQVKADGTKVLYSEKIAAWGRSSEAANKLGALSKRGAPYFVVAMDQLDADPMKINMRNGTIVVRRRPNAAGSYIEFKPHDPADLITKVAPVDYDPNAVSPEYDKFMGEIQPLESMRNFLHQWGGLSLTGDVSEQKLAFFYGKGGNGKSVLNDAWSYVAGDYGETVPIETFLDQGKARSAGQATPDLAILPGKRMLRTSEPEKGSKLAEALIKLVTGGEPIQARHLNRDFFKFYPQFKLTMSGNYRPTISGTDDGIWRRVRLVPFTVSIPKEQRDVHLGDKLRREASGILNRLLAGLVEWLGHGLHEPDEVLKATAEYQADSDALGRFLKLCVVAEPGARIQSSVLHALYVAWCKSSGEKEWSNKGLTNAMSERGFNKLQSNFMFWLDVKLVKNVNDFVDHEGRPLKSTESADDDEPF